LDSGLETVIEIIGYRFGYRGYRFKTGPVVSGNLLPVLYSIL